MSVMKCKGFWNMCSCEKCRKADRELEHAIETNPQARKDAMREALAHHQKERSR